MNKKVLVAGPWFGEFGGELEHWHAWLRHKRKHVYPDHYFVAISFPGRELFYEFADEFWGLPQDFMNWMNSKKVYTVWCGLRDAANGEMLPSHHEDIQHLISWVKRTAEEKFPDAEIEYLQPHVGLNPNDFVKDEEQEYKLIEAPVDVDVQNHLVIFPRNRANEPHRNWSKDRWEQLVKRLLDDGHTIVCNGTAYETFKLDIEHERYIDIIGSDLRTQVAYLQTARYAVTPICGAIRFAAYVGTPTISFGPVNYLAAVEREEGKSLFVNPFGTPLLILTTKVNSWDYSVDEVYGYINNLMKS